MASMGGKGPALVRGGTPSGRCAATSPVKGGGKGPLRPPVGGQLPRQGGAMSSRTRSLDRVPLRIKKAGASAKLAEAPFLLFVYRPAAPDELGPGAGCDQDGPANVVKTQPHRHRHVPQVHADEGAADVQPRMGPDVLHRHGA